RGLLEPQDPIFEHLHASTQRLVLASQSREFVGPVLRRRGRRRGGSAPQHEQQARRERANSPRSRGGITFGTSRQRTHGGPGSWHGFQEATAATKPRPNI